MDIFVYLTVTEVDKINKVAHKLVSLFDEAEREGYWRDSKPYSEIFNVVISTIAINGYTYASLLELVNLVHDNSSQFAMFGIDGIIINWNDPDSKKLDGFTISYKPLKLRLRVFMTRHNAYFYRAA